MPENKRTAITLSNLHVGYGKGALALENVSAVVPIGSVAALIGPNGAGKSTLLKCMVGLIKPQSGSITVFDAAFSQVRKLVSYMPQRAEVDWHFPITAMGVVAMGAAANSQIHAACPNQHQSLRQWWQARRKRIRIERDFIMDCLNEVQLADLANRPISALSGGQQQRLFLARSLAQQAELYLMDEPFAALDPASTERILEIFKKLHKSGATLLCAHHDMRLLESEFTHCIALDRNVTGQGKPSDVLSYLRTMRHSTNS